MISRRSLLLGAPAFVLASSLMPLRGAPLSDFITTPPDWADDPWLNLVRAAEECIECIDTVAAQKHIDGICLNIMQRTSRKMKIACNIVERTIKVDYVTP